MKQSIRVMTYICLGINILLSMLFCVAYCIYEVDLFVVVWLSSALGLFTFPIGIGLSIYALVQKQDKFFRKVTLIWNAAIIGLFGLTFYVLPSGTERLVNGMEDKYLSHYDAIQHLCAYATDSLVLPDSAALVVTKDGNLQTCKVVGKVFFMPSVIYTEDTTFVIDENQSQRLLQLHKASKMGEFTVYRPDNQINITFSTRGFGRFWYEIPYHPYTEEEMYFHLNNYHYCPYTREICFLFDGGAIHHDAPFPMKDQFLQSHGIDSLSIYHLFH